MIKPLSEILAKAEKGHYAIGAFNTSNLEMTLAIARAAAKLKSPVIIQTSESAIKYSNLPIIYNLIKNTAETVAKNVPVAIHLDHGKDLSIIGECIKIGYTSVHIDASEKDFATNVRLSLKVRKLAKKYHTFVQSELGSILGKEGLVRLEKGEINMEELMTDPEQAQKFIKLTKVDTLAISVGTIHGRFVGIEKVDQVRLKKIHSLVKVPLVLHGASGLSPRDLREAVANGVRIVNIDTNLRVVFKKALWKSMSQEKNLIDPRAILTPSMASVQAEVERIIKILGSANKA